MIAAGLDRDETAYPGKESGGDGRRRCRHDVTDNYLAFIGECVGAILVRVADDLRHLRHCGEAVGIELSRAAGDDDPPVWPLAMCPANCLPGLADGLVRDGTA